MVISLVDCEVSSNSGRVGVFAANGTVTAPIRQFHPFSLDVKLTNVNALPAGPVESVIAAVRPISVPICRNVTRRRKLSLSAFALRVANSAASA